MDAHDAAVASFVAFQFIMVSPIAPASPSIGRPRAIAQAYRNISDTNSVEEAWRPCVRGILLRKQRETVTFIVPSVPDRLAPDKEVTKYFLPM